MTTSSPLGNARRNDQDSVQCQAMRRNPYGFAFVRRTSPLLRETPTLMGAGVAGNAPTCPLLFLRESLYLISFLSVTEKMLTPHFLRHYTSRVGIKAEHIRLLLHLPCRSCHNRTATLSQRPCRIPNTHTLAPRSTGCGWKAGCTRWQASASSTSARAPRERDVL